MLDELGAELVKKLHFGTASLSEQRQVSNFVVSTETEHYKFLLSCLPWKDYFKHYLVDEPANLVAALTLFTIASSVGKSVH